MRLPLVPALCSLSRLLAASCLLFSGLLHEIVYMAMLLSSFYVTEFGTISLATSKPLIWLCLQVAALIFRSPLYLPRFLPVVPPMHCPVANVNCNPFSNRPRYKSPALATATAFFPCSPHAQAFVTHFRPLLSRSHRLLANLCAFRHPPDGGAALRGAPVARLLAVPRANPFP
jgi:hypothetical protein